MNQFSRLCTIKNHNDQYVEYVCVDPQCKSSRFLCYMCFQEGIHLHQNNGKSAQFNDYFAKIKDSRKSNNGLCFTIVKQIRQILLHFKTLISEILQKVLVQINQKQLEEYENIIKQGFNHIDNEFIRSIIDLQELNKKQEIFDLTSKYSNLIIQNISTLQELSKSQIVQQQEQISQQDSQIQLIKSASYDISKVHEADGDDFFKTRITASISNNLKYIIASVKDNLHIWDYKTYALIKKIDFDSTIDFCKFTDDSTTIYVAVGSDLFNLQERLSFSLNKKSYIPMEHSLFNMIFINNSQILAAHQHGHLCKYNSQFKTTDFSINAHEYSKIKGLDYDKILNMIASGANDKSIKIWHGNQGFKILEKKSAHGGKISQIQFFLGKQQLVSCEKNGQLIIWKINPQKEQLLQLKQIKYWSGVFNFSLVLKEEYILLNCKESVKIHSIDGQFIREFNHYLKSPKQFQTVQIETMQAIILIGQKQIRICKQK